MRHAKSDWSANGDDHDRPLNERGMKSAPAMGQWLHDMGWLPGEILCSTATRTRQTLDLLNVPDASTRFERALYLAEAEDMIGAIQTAEADTVLVLGHNHGIAECAHRLVANWPEHPRFMDYPTCATSVIHFDVEDWSLVTEGVGVCDAFSIPREVIANRSAD